MIRWRRQAKNAAAFPEHRVQWGALTDPGLVRQENQDAFGYRQPEDAALLEQKGVLFVVADGMGGHRGGATASRLAVQVILREYYASRARQPGEGIRAAVEAAHRAVREKSLASRELQGMGTTVVILALQDGHAHVGHVGDSRAYLIQGDRIRRLTRDHSLVQQWVDQGVMNADEARRSERKNVLTRVLGVRGESVAVDLLSPPHVLAPGDTFVLCSDGLHGVVEDDEIRDLVRRHEPQEACQALVALARERGGPDNITVQVVTWTEDSPVRPETAPGDEETRTLSRTAGGRPA